MLKLTTGQIQQLVLDAIPGDCLHKDGGFRTYNPYIDGAWSKTIWFCVACDADIGNQFLPSNQNPWKHKPGCVAVEQFAKMCKAIERLKDNAVDIAAAYTHIVYELERVNNSHTQELAKRETGLQNYVATVTEQTRENKALVAAVVQLNKENESLREENKSLLAIKNHFDSVIDQILPLTINIGDLEAANGS